MRAKRFTKTLYMHTLNGMPAQMTNTQICFAGRAVKRFASSLKQIRQEQQASEDWRQKHGFRDQFKHGHICVRIAPEDLSSSNKESAK